MKLVLASSSPYRRELLQRLTKDFVWESPDIDETRLAGESPQQMVERLALGKAQAIASKYPNALIIGSDQIACHGDDIVGKPQNHEDAVRQLQSASASTVQLYTGLALVNSTSGRVQTEVVPFSVTFRALTLDTIERYLQADRPYDCAGSVKVEQLGIALLEKMSGDDPNALIGLPLIKLVDMLNNEQYQLLA